MNYHPKIPANLHLVANPTVAPRHQHDCNCCHFLGRLMTENGDADLYAHASGRSPTVIARFSSDGPDYSSGLTAAYGTVSYLTEARLRAQKLGLMEYNVLQALEYAKANTPEYEELKRGLPFTVEYQAVLASERGDVERSYALVSYLVDRERLLNKRYFGEPRPATAFDNVESRIIKVLQAYRGYSWEQAYLHLSPMMGHEEALLQVEPSPCFQEADTDDMAQEIAA